MRSMLALVALFGSALATAQVTSSANLDCTVVAPKGMLCNGIGVPDIWEGGKRIPKKEGGMKTPKLFVTNITLEPGAELEPPADSDCLLIGINGGDLLNEKPPFLHVDLGKESVTLMPREQPFRLRNKGSVNVEFRMIEIRR